MKGIKDPCVKRRFLEMKIIKKKVKNLDSNLLGISSEESFYIGKRISEVSEKLLKKLGFTQPPIVGIKMLCRAMGPVSKRNVYGESIPQKNQPKETVYHEACIQDWHGGYHYIDIPYKRYPRKYIKPICEELTVIAIKGELFLVSRKLKHTHSYENINRHIINLFLEYFGDCEVLNDKLENAMQNIPIRRVNWEILPEGEYPWDRIKEIGIVSSRPKKALRQKHTFEFINQYNPSEITIGIGGFHGYVVFSFSDKEISVFEHLLYGNATYIFDKDWQTLSQLSKGEILHAGLEKARIVHREGWENNIRKILND